MSKLPGWFASGYGINPQKAPQEAGALLDSDVFEQEAETLLEHTPPTHLSHVGLRLLQEVVVVSTTLLRYCLLLSPCVTNTSTTTRRPSGS